MAARPRRTAAEVQQAITDAVLAELNEAGFAGLTFEKVARRAGTSRPVLYRRYPDRAAMAVQTLGSSLSTIIPEPQDSLREDLIAWLQAAHNRTITIGPRNLRGLLGEVGDTDLDLVLPFVAGAADLVRERVLEPAQRRGELGDTVIPDEIVNVPFVLARDQTIFTSTREPDLAGIVDTIAVPLYRLWSTQGRRLTETSTAAR
ncbi:MAG: TetR/AcrR family transcriptional regulator [Propionicimonas sp.]|uniref:TetR/AcrR family transcriptional regulator n=1 Tax=Propionicimonas sp. TaxID=1955623 RepID=UPI002B20A1B2|nr:TetR/AcrR family transcriptional regulator [Propionicimonas sp.]MEA4944422.1 TetR/AcrR family transcriptional regulator [Propionicimonas sp.]MEA5051997.1 TetR/AcrR family transcriptional regulator [Propionicimonas sp.]